MAGTMDILLTGGAGQVGTELRAATWPAEVRLHAPDRTALDLADPASVAGMAASRAWSAIISSGAYTAVDKAESDVATAWATNALAPAILSRAAAEAGIPIVHVSTDYVFPGSKAGPYHEDDPIGPLGVYGASKEGGEQAVRSANTRHAIVRTAWVVSAHRANFVKTMLRLAADRDEVRVVADQLGCPTVAADLAVALRTIVLRMTEDPSAPAGTFHYVNAGETNWAAFAEAIFAASAARGGPTARVVPITTAEYPTPARRPANSRLATDKVRAAYGVDTPDWRASLERIVAALV